MRKIILLLTLCFLIVHLFAQSDRKNLIETHIALGAGGYGPVGLVGAPSYNTKCYYTIGLDYSRRLSKHWDFCSGFEYTYNSMTAKSITTGKLLTAKAHLTMTTIPVQLKYHFGRFMYLNGGMLLNITAKEQMNNFWTLLDQKNNVALLLGVGLGIGFDYEFNSGITLSINPYARYNGIGKAVSLQSESLEHYKYIQGGVRLGIGYKF